MSSDRVFNMQSVFIPDQMRLMIDAMKAVEKEDKTGAAANARKDVRVEYAGDKIVLPDDMSFDEAISWLQRRKTEDQTIVRVVERIEAFPLDGAAAFHRVLARRYGWTGLVPSPGFFGQKNPPTMVGVEIGPGQTIQVAWGRCQVPKIEGFLSTNFKVLDGRPIPVFQLVCEVQRRHENTVKELAAEVREEVLRASIYRGKPIKVSFRDSDGDEIDGEDYTPDSFQPRFLDLTRVSPEDVIHQSDTERMIRINLFHPIERTAEFRRHGIPLRQGVLLEGPYGTGKTLTAYILARACVAHGWTFLYLDDVRDLDKAISLARLYQPCVVFAEDVDRVVSGEREGDNGIEIDRVLNTLDGVDSKDAEVMVVLTTNDLKAIHPAMLRPGRIDVVVSVRAPDLEATIRLARRFGRDLIIADDTELAEVLSPIVGQNAAFVRETIERAKRSAIAHAGEGRPLVVTPADLAFAAESLRPHVELLNPVSAVRPPAGALFMDELAHGVSERLANNGLAKKG